MRGTHRAAIATGTALASALAWWACGPGDLGDLTRGSRDAETSNDVAPDAIGDARDTCLVRGVVERPTDDAAVGETSSLVFALSALRLDTSSRDASIPAPIGLNLDRTCGCSCVRPTSVRCDEEDPPGNDNQTAKLFNTAGGANFLKIDTVEKSLRAGGFSVLIGLGGWNKEPNDPDVVVSIWASPGLESDAGGPPRFDGTDTWLIDSDSLALKVDDGVACGPGACPSRYTSVEAYVRDGRVVASFTDLTIQLLTEGGRFSMRLSDATATGLLKEDTSGGGYRIEEGLLAGRVPAKELISSAAKIKIGDASVCNDPTLYGGFKSLVCGNLDITAQPGIDPNAECDALSTALSFVGTIAKRGTVASRPELPSDCPDATDSCN